jgi:hypothetical protein
MNARFKWAIALITVGILFTIGGAMSRILNSSGSNNMLLTGLAAHVSGFSIVIYDLLYSKSSIN